MAELIQHKISPELIQAVKNNNLVLFVGAGTSWNLINTKRKKLEGWKNLVVKLLNHLIDKKYTVDSLLSIVNDFDPIDVLKLLEKKKEIPSSLLTEFICDFYSVNDENDYSLHKKLYSLTPKIITTNYDRAFELSIPELRKYTAHSKKEFELSKIINSDQFLLKLHGCAENGDSMILFPKDYDKLYVQGKQSSKAVLHVLSHLIADKTILFIGCGLGDFQINNIFKSIKNIVGKYSKSHFVFSKTNINEKLNFVQTIKIDNYHEIDTIVEELLKHKRQKDSFNEHELEDSIQKAQKNLENVQEELREGNKSIEEIQRKLLKRIALQEFTKGANFHKKKKLNKAIEYYRTSSEYDKSNESTYLYWGNALAQLGQKKNKKSFVLDALTKYKCALRINNSSYRIYNNWGAALLVLGSTILKDDSFISESILKFKKSLSFKHDYSHALCNLGLAYFKLGELKNDISTIKESLKYFKNAEASDNRFSVIFINWGSALYSIGDIEQNEKIVLDAISKFKKSIEINPSCEKSYYNMGNSYFLLSKISKNKEYSESAYEYFEIAKSLGHHCFNLACWYAQNSRVIESVKILKYCIKKRIVTTQLIESISDFDEIKTTTEFKNFINKVS